MDRSGALQPVLFGLLVAGAALVCPVASADPPPGRALYHPDPQHLWNRLHEALFVRTGADGRAYGGDSLEPLLWPGTKHLLEGRSRDRALALLEEFVNTRGEKLIDDPLKRAVLQRDLWLVFNWLEGSHGGIADPHFSREEVDASQRRLRRPLAAVIGRLALSPEEIKHLPDTYTAAVTSGAFAKGYDPEQPDRPFLPPDLFAADGPWVCLGRPDGPVTPAHLRDDVSNPFTNSAFLVFLRLPAGHDATLEYLNRLRTFDQPLLVRVESAEKRTDKYLPNPKLPPFPVGTEVALVRRALLIDPAHRVRPSALTESVQVRHYREVPAMSWRSLDAALGGGTAANRQAHSWQAFHEFRLSRSLLFAGRAGGLRAVGPDERDFETGFGAPYHYDAFEELPDRSSEPRRESIKETCFACHSLPGVYSFNSFFNFRLSNLQDGDSSRPVPLAEMSPEEVSGAAVQWKESRPGWTSLRGLLAE
jgi:hypothetical protein